MTDLHINILSGFETRLCFWNANRSCSNVMRLLLKKGIKLHAHAIRIVLKIIKNYESIITKKNTTRNNGYYFLLCCFRNVIKEILLKKLKCNLIYITSKKIEIKPIFKSL